MKTNRYVIMLTLTVGLASTMVVERIISNAAISTALEHTEQHDEWAKAQVDSILAGLAVLAAPSCTLYVPIAVPPLSLSRVYALMDSLSTRVIVQEEQIEALTQLVVGLNDSLPVPSLYVVLDHDTVMASRSRSKWVWKWYWPLPKHVQPQR